MFVGEQATRYAYVYWNMGWSQNSRWIGCKARLRMSESDEIVIASIEDSKEFKVLHSASGIGSDIAWSPDHQRIAFPINPGNGRQPGLFTVSREKAGPAERSPLSQSDLKIVGFDWSHDGKYIAIAGQKIAQPSKESMDPFGTKPTSKIK